MLEIRYDDPMLLDTLAHLFTPRHTNNHRPRIIHPEGFLVLTFIAFGFFLTLKTVVIPIGGILGYTSTISPARIIELTNSQRKANGEDPLSINVALTNAAAAKASDMFAKQYWAHVSPDGTTPWVFIKNAGYTYQIAGENLARDFADNDSVINAWMNSPSHRENLLQVKYKDIGVAVVNGVLNGVETTLVVQEFGSSTQAETVQIQPKINQQAAVITVPTQTALTPVEHPQTASVLAQEQQATPFPIVNIPLTRTPLFSPLQLSKAFSLGMLLLLLCVLFYDMIVAHHQNTIRIVGKNIAHILLFLTVMFLVIFFKGGLIS